ncbi:MAG: NINE protein [Planctomycetes bacterium]|nr:NINE protein [Planctomycetota bacterium]
MASTAQKITVRHGDRNFGPYVLDDVNRLLAEGRLSHNDLAWVEGSPEWVRLGYVPGTMAVPPVRGMVDGEAVSDRRIVPAFLLAFFLGVFGVHRFYCGRTGSGIAMLVVTLTLIGSVVTAIWATVDWILIVCGVFRDGEGRRITEWT